MNSGVMLSPAANSSDVSSQSTRPSFRAMNPSRLATIWIVTRESVLAIITEKSASDSRVPRIAVVRGRLALSVAESLERIGQHETVEEFHALVAELARDAQPQWAAEGHREVGTVHPPRDQRL